MELTDYLRVARAYWRGIVAFVLLGVAVAAGVSLVTPKVYQADASGLVSAGVATNPGEASVADSLATGPAAWGGWKAQLVADLVERTSVVLGGGSLTDIPRDRFPGEAHLALMAAGEQVLDGRDDTLTVVTHDRPGVFSKVAGVLALHGLAVLDANAYSSDDGMALARFRVESSFGPIIPWDRVTADLERCFAGRLALAARLHRAGKRLAEAVMGDPAKLPVRHHPWI